MPLYEYRCDKCGAIEERMHAAKVRAWLTCPACGHEPMTWQFPAPALLTNTEFMANRDDGFGSRNRERKRAYARARAAGVNPTGKTYMPGLADSLYDPKAWINDNSDVARLCRQQGRACEGCGIHVKAPQRIDPPEPKPYRVADDIVERETSKAAVEFGKLSVKERRQLKKETRERITPTFGVPGKTPKTPLREYV